MLKQFQIPPGVEICVLESDMRATVEAVFSDHGMSTEHAVSISRFGHVGKRFSCTAWQATLLASFAIKAGTSLRQRSLA